MYIKIFILIILFLYLSAILSWYYYPTHVTNTEYKNVGKIKMEDIKGEKILFVADHEHSNMSQISILSNEIWKNKTTFVFLMRKHLLWAKKIKFYLSKNDRLVQTTNTVEKSVNLLNNENKNLVIFLKNKHSEHNGKGIYHILKKTNARLILVKKKKIGEKKPGRVHKFLENILSALSVSSFLDNGIYEIEYIDIGKNYDTTKLPEKFMKNLKQKLFN